MKDRWLGSGLVSDLFTRIITHVDANNVELQRYRALMDAMERCNIPHVSVARCQVCMLPFDGGSDDAWCYASGCPICLECPNCKGKYPTKCVSCDNKFCKCHARDFLPCCVCGGWCCLECAHGWPDDDVHVCGNCPLPDSPRRK